MPTGLCSNVKGSVGDIERAFRVRMGVYQHPTEGRTFHAPDTDPSVELGVPILGIVGLDDFILPRPMNLEVASESTNANIVPVRFRAGGIFSRQ